jgi:hypothetical protein
MTDQESEKLDQLLTQAQLLTDQFAVIAKDSGRQFTSLAHTARRNRMMIWALAVGGAVLTLVCVILVFLVIGQRSNTDRIDKIATETQTTQIAQRQRALCPLYGIFVDSKSAEGRARSADPEQYDHAFEVIEEGYSFLGCDKYLKESGRDKW